MVRLSHLRRLAVAGALLCACLAAPLAHADGFAAVRQAARAEGLHEKLVLAVASVESGGNCHARSSAGAVGVLQVKPATARSVGIHGNLTDCATGAIAGVRYLKAALRVAHGNVAAALTLYNQGLAARPVRSRYAALVMSRVR